MKTESKNTVVPVRSLFPDLPAIAVLAVIAAANLAPMSAAAGPTDIATGKFPTLHKTIKVNGLDIFYRYFALEEEGATIAAHIRSFLAKQKL